MRIRSAFGWVTDAMILKRWQVIAIAGLLGVALAGMLYVGLEEAHNAKDARDKLERSDVRQRATSVRLADAIARLERLEHPTTAQVRAEVDRFLRGLQSATPAQRRRLTRIVTQIVRRDTRARGPRGPRGGNGSSSPGTNGGAGGTGANPPSPPVSPPASPPAPGPTPPSTPTPPLTPTPLPPVIDVPPIDADGPGPLPPIDLPPIPLVPPLP